MKSHRTRVVTFFVAVVALGALLAAQALPQGVQKGATLAGITCKILHGTHHSFL